MSVEMGRGGGYSCLKHRPRNGMYRVAALAALRSTGMRRWKATVATSFQGSEAVAPKSAARMRTSVERRAGRGFGMVVVLEQESCGLWRWRGWDRVELIG